MATEYRIARSADLPAIQELAPDMHALDTFGIVAYHDGSLEGYIGLNYRGQWPIVDIMAVKDTPRKYRQIWDLIQGLELWLGITGMEGCKYLFYLESDVLASWRTIVDRCATKYAAGENGIEWYYRYVPSFEELQSHVRK